MQCSWNIFKVKENSRYMMCSSDGSVRGAHHISVIFFYLENIAGSLYVSNDLASLASVVPFAHLISECSPLILYVTSSVM